MEVKRSKTTKGKFFKKVPVSRTKVEPNKVKCGQCESGYMEVRMWNYYVCVNDKCRNTRLK